MSPRRPQEVRNDHSETENEPQEAPGGQESEAKKDPVSAKMSPRRRQEPKNGQNYSIC